MAKKIDIRDLYLSVVNSMDDANRKVETQDEEDEREYSYAITDLEFSIPFEEMEVDQDGKVQISLAEPGGAPDQTRNLKFKVRYVPKPPKEEKPPVQTDLLMPALVEKNAEAAVKIIQEVGLTLGNVHYNPMGKPYGIVLAQAPEAGTSVSPGDKVSLVIAGIAPGTEKIKTEEKPADNPKAERTKTTRPKKSTSKGSPPKKKPDAKK